MAHTTCDPSRRAIDVGALGLDGGAHILLARALGDLAPGERLFVEGNHPALGIHLRAWARREGHAFSASQDGLVLIRGDKVSQRWSGAVRAGEPTKVVDQASQSWAFAARGSLVESGEAPYIHFDLDRKDLVWSDVAPKLYAQAMANQWDPATAIDWSPPALPADVEQAVVQVMTYLVENEQAALAVPARVLGRIHPHYREVIGLLSTQIADEARHAEVFTRRARLCNDQIGASGYGGRLSLQSLVVEPDWANSSFLLSVMGEGTFLTLLAFLERYGPDAVTAQIAHRVLLDEARHVAFSMAYLAEHAASSVEGRDRLRAAVERRHDILAGTVGVTESVRDSLVILAAGSWDADSIHAGWKAVSALEDEMDEARRRRLVRLGFDEAEAEEVSALHTRNYM